MSSWADESEQGPHPSYSENRSYGGGSGSSAPPQRKRLQLKPRSAKGVAEAQAASPKKNNPFGAAKPREEVLASKGIDAKLVDERIQKKATVVHLTKDQEAEVEGLRSALTQIEEDLRDANEKELPEEEFRVAAEKKRKELNDLMAKFAEINLKKQDEPSGHAGGHGTEGRPHYERPSERRKRLEQQHHEGDEEEEVYDDAFASFGGRHRHHGKRDDHHGGHGRGGHGHGGHERYNY